MVDVFISYARENQAVAQRLADAVKQLGYRVWWDDEIPPHLSYSALIGEKIASAKAAIVIWSTSAAASEWVRAEADVARAARKLIQTSVDGTTPPLPFNLIQFAAIGDWNGEDNHPGWKAVRTSITALCGPPEAEPAAMPEASPVVAPAPPPVAVAPMPAFSTPPTTIPPAEPAPVQSGRGGGVALALAGAGGAAVLALGAVLLLRGDPPAPTGNDATTVPNPLVQTTSPNPPSAPVPITAPQQADLARFTQPGSINGVAPLEVYAGPSQALGVVARVNAGDAFSTYPQTGAWWRVRTANGRVGFVEAARVRIGNPADAMTMDGQWTVTWVAGGAPYNASMRVDGSVATMDVRSGGSVVRQDCAVAATGPEVRIQCRNPRYLSGKGTYSPDAFQLRLTEGRTIMGRIRDAANVRASAIFSRHGGPAA